MTDFIPGDIVEIRLGDRRAYVHVTHDHPSYPPAIAALPGRFGSRPVDLPALARQTPDFRALVPLGDVLRKLDLPHEVAGRADVPEMAQGFPEFRMPVRGKSGEVLYWWFWDGRGLRYSTDLSDGERSLPAREVLGAEEFLATLRGAADGSTPANGGDRA